VKGGKGAKGEKGLKGVKSVKGVKRHKTEGMEKEYSNGPQPKTEAKYFTCGASELGW
jgi:hypothetical protein